MSGSYAPEPDKYRNNSPAGPGQEHTPTEAEIGKLFVIMRTFQGATQVDAVAEFQRGIEQIKAHVRAEADELGGDLIRLRNEAVLRAEVAEHALADERAKRPDRERVKAILAAHTCTSAHGLGNGVTVAYCECGWWGTSEDCKDHRADAVLSSLALEPGAREETTAEVNIDTRLLVLGAGAGQRFVGPFPNNSSALNWAREHAPDVTHVSSVMWPQHPDDAAAVTDG